MDLLTSKYHDSQQSSKEWRQIKGKKEDWNIYNNFCHIWDVIKLTDYVILNWHNPTDVPLKILNLNCLSFGAYQGNSQTHAALGLVTLSAPALPYKRRRTQKCLLINLLTPSMLPLNFQRIDEKKGQNSSMTKSSNHLTSLHLTWMRSLCAELSYDLKRSRPYAHRWHEPVERWMHSRGWRGQGKQMQALLQWDWRGDNVGWTVLWLRGLFVHLRIIKTQNKRYK